MTKEDLQKLIDLEVSKVFITLTDKEPEPKSEKPRQPIQTQANLTEDELDLFLFYGGKEKEKK